jgi:hypothetical protein
MTLSLNCKDAEKHGTNAKKHSIEVHGYTEETWNEEMSKNKDHFRSQIKKA